MPDALEEALRKNESIAEKTEKRRDILVICVGIAIVLDMLILTYNFGDVNRRFTSFNTVLFFLFIAVTAAGLLMLLPIFELKKDTKRMLTVIIASMFLIFSILCLIIFKPSGIFAVALGLMTLLSILIFSLPHLDINRKFLAPFTVSFIGTIIVSIVPVHEAFDIFPTGDVTSASNISLLFAGFLVMFAGFGLIFILADWNSRTITTYILWLVGLALLLLVPFHEFFGITSNGIYGPLDQTLTISGVIMVAFGTGVFARKKMKEIEHDREIMKGDSYYVSQEYEMSILHYTNALHINKDSARARINKSRALCRLENYDDALKEIEKAIEIDYTNHIAYSVKAMIFRRMKKYDKALTFINKAIEIMPDYAEAWLTKGNILSEMGKIKDAIECYDKSIFLRPDYAKAYYNKGKVLNWIGKKKDAKKCLRKAKELGYTMG